MTRKKVTLRTLRLSASLVLMAGVIAPTMLDHVFGQVYEKNECHDPNVAC